MAAAAGGGSPVLWGPLLSAFKAFAAAPPPPPPEPYEGAAYALREGLRLGLVFLANMAVLEVLSLRTARQIWRRPGGKQFYAQAVAFNVFNMCVLTPVMYLGAMGGNLQRLMDDERDPPAVQALKVAVGLGLQSLWYYAAHLAMHTQGLYWIHRFHHRFQKYICPVAGNAVTPLEFVLAYAAPFTVGGVLLAPDRVTIELLVHGIGFTNLLIHTPWLEEASRKVAPEWLVSSWSHAEHHRKFTLNYAAPTLNVDPLFRGWGALDRAYARCFGKPHGGGGGRRLRPRKGDRAAAAGGGGGGYCEEE